MSVVDLKPFNDILARLETVAGRLEAGTSSLPAAAASPAPRAGGPAPAATADAPIAISFDAAMTEKLKALGKAAEDVGAKDVTEATEFFMTAIGLLRGMLAVSDKCKKPKDADWPAILVPVIELGQKSQKAIDNRSEYFQNRKSASEALNVVMIPQQPAPPGWVQQCLETMDFHAIKVMQKKNAGETAWAKALKAVVVDLKTWCSEECKMGVTWNAQGMDAAEFFKANPLGSAKAAGKGTGKGKAPPPPAGGFQKPPPEVLEKQRASAPAGGGAAGGMAALFQGISDFSTSGLRKVTDDMKTKNRTKDDVPAPPAPAAPAAPKARASVSGGRPAGKGPKGPPKKELEKGLNWMIENYEGVSDMVLDDSEVEKQHLVCILNCKSVTLQIKTKVKSISIDGCDRVNVICQDVISVVELVNCDRCKVQTLGKVNSFAVDKCDGVNIYLSRESIGAELVTSKSSDMNVTITEEGTDEPIEIPIPEQFVSKIVGKKLQTEVSSLYS